MKTVIIIEVDHRQPIPHLANMVAGRAYTINGVTNAEVMKLSPMTPQELQSHGFSLSEISLGAQEEVVRG